MRNAFASEITELAAADPRIILLSGDIGNRLFDTYKDQFPQRFLNCGVAEANMIGVSAGLALSGLRPVASAMPFCAARHFCLFRPSRTSSAPAAASASATARPWPSVAPVTRQTRPVMS